MRGNLLFGAATAALLMFASNASAQNGDPPGDASTQAQFTGAALEGEIAPVGDVDWYRMRVEQGQRYSFTLDAIPGEDGAALDPMLALYDAAGEQLAFNDDSGGSLNSALSFVPQQSGEVFVEARAFADAGAGRYVLAASASVIPPDDVGNDASTRARVTPGRPVTGNLEYEGDVDWYRMSVRTGQRYRITLVGTEGADNPLGDPYLRVLDRAGETLAANDDDGESLNSAIDFVPSASGDVFVEARAFADAYVGTYTLNVAAERLPSDNYSGDRNTRGRINVGQSVESTLDFPGDRDWFRIRLQEGQSYRFTLNSAGAAPLGDPLLRLYNSAGQELAYDDDGGPGLNSYLEFAAPATGNYFLEARGFGDDATGGYVLRAMAGDIPADASTDAVLSADGDWRQGVLSPAGDRDWYRIDLVEGQAVRVGLDSAEGGQALGDPYLVMYGPDSVEVARDDDGGVGLNALLEYRATVSGPHYVEARGFSESAAGDYAISVMAGEIGDSQETADFLLPGHEGRYSRVDPAGDVDWFGIELVEGRPYRFSLMGGSEDGALNDPLLRLYDSEGNQVAMDDDGGTGLNSYLTYVSVSGGTYFAAASAFGDGTGMYWLRVLDTDVPGHIYTDEDLDSAGDDRISRIDMPSDLDYFRVQLDGGARYIIELRGHGDQPLADPFVAIMDENNERLASDDDSGRGLDARLRFQPRTSGTYYIQASGLGGSTGWYQVSIVRQ